MLKTVSYSFFFGNLNKCFPGIVYKWEAQKHLFEIEIFCNIINALNVTFHQFIASLQDKSINLCQNNNNKNVLTPNFRTVNGVFPHLAWNGA